MNRWRLHVEGLGKIRTADVEIGPFTMFVGDNNSGKSYLMTLIWAIRKNVIADIFAYETRKEWLIQIVALDEYEKCLHLLERYERDAISSLSQEEIDSIVRLFNALLRIYKNEICEQLFHSEVVKLTALSVSLLSYQAKPRRRMTIRERMLWGERECYLGDDCEQDAFLKEVSGKLYVLAKFCNELFGTKDGQEESAVDVYFPTSRTGFILSYKMLVDYMISKPSFGIGNKQSDYTMPCIDFIRCINMIGGKQTFSRCEEVLSFMEKNIITGKLTLGQTYSTEFYYTPDDGMVESLPMKLCSGVVTEVALVILFLKHLGLASVTIEEPEMCLHPRLQWQYARAFVKMYHAGLPILMATHSDIFMAQINNMIKLNSHPDKEMLMEEYGYEDNDLIEAGDVKVYQFDVQKDGSTKITEIEADEDGFHIPSFQKTLNELLQQSMAFEMEED